MGQNIIVNKEQMTFTLNTNNSSYQMKVDKYKRLLHTWYGGKFLVQITHIWLRF